MSGRPAQAGEEVVVRATGIGSVEALSVDVGGLPAQVEAVSAERELPGIYAVRLRIPENTAPGDSVPVTLWVTAPDGNRFGSNSVMLAVE